MEFILCLLIIEILLLICAFLAIQVYYYGSIYKIQKKYTDDLNKIFDDLLKAIKKKEKKK